MTVEEALNLSSQELNSMSAEQLYEVLKPIVNTTRKRLDRIKNEESRAYERMQRFAIGGMETEAGTIIRKRDFLNIKRNLYGMEYISVSLKKPSNIEGNARNYYINEYYELRHFLEMKSSTIMGIQDIEEKRRLFTEEFDYDSTNYTEYNFDDDFIFEEILKIDELLSTVHSIADIWKLKGSYGLTSGNIRDIINENTVDGRFNAVQALGQLREKMIKYAVGLREEMPDFF